jgi:hypothetical protein
MRSATPTQTEARTGDAVPTGATPTVRRPRRRTLVRTVVAVAMVSVLGLALTACDPTYQLNGGHPPCGTALRYRVNPAGFSAAELTAIQRAAAMIGAEAHVNFQYDGQTNESWASLTPPPSADHVLVEHRTTIVDGHQVSGAVSLQLDGSGTYRGGSMWFAPSADSLPAAATLDGTWGSTFLKLALHEWMHYVGLADLDGSHPESMMGGATAPDLSAGDHAGLQANGC